MDLRVAFRSLGRQRGFAVLVIATLGLGIGAGTSLFGVVDAVLLARLPYPDAGRVVSVSESNLGKGQPRFGVSTPAFHEIASLRSLTAAAAYSESSANLAGPAEPQHVEVTRATPELLDVLGLVPSLGRMFRPEEARGGSAPVALLAEPFWRKEFGADPS